MIKPNVDQETVTLMSPASQGAGQNLAGHKAQCFQRKKRLVEHELPLGAWA